MPRVDLKGAFLSLKYEIAYMAASGSGSIINIASVSGVIGPTRAGSRRWSDGALEVPGRDIGDTRFVLT
jgi:NAD(P)-dependent dehydrogenase (short-subunit alcohol dehydrogenase family)